MHSSLGTKISHETVKASWTPTLRFRADSSVSSRRMFDGETFARVGASWRNPAAHPSMAD